jgi:hypothetical protein
MKAHPRIQFLGIQDQSIPVQEPSTETAPQHLPLFMGPAAWGDTKATYNDGTLFTRRYHESTLDLRGKYLTHSTPYISGCLGAPNPIFFKRLEMPGSETAGLSIAHDVLETEIPLYEVDEDGHFITDEGDLVPTGETTMGLSIIPIVTNLDFSTMGDGTKVPGIQTVNGVTSQIYKLLDLPGRFFGSLGNGIGIRLSSPKTNSTDPVDIDSMLEQNAYFHRLSVVLKEDPRYSANVWKTFYGARSIDFTLKPDAYHPTSNKDLYLPLSYENEYVNEATDVNGPFGDMFVYQDNIDELLGKMQTLESAVNSRVDSDPDKMYLMNLFNASDYNGIPYRAIALDGSLNNYPEFTEINTHYLVGGSDGTLTQEAVEAEIANQLRNFGTLEDNFKDIAQFPFTCFYDTGFGLDTKYAMAEILAARSDMDILPVAYIASESRPTVSSEISITTALRARYRLVPESTVYGTSTCRVTIMAGSARILNSTYPKYVPSNYELMMKRAKYMGSADGLRKDSENYTVHPKNKIEYLRSEDITDTWVEPGVRNQQWTVGLTNIHSSGMKEKFIPAFQTIYDSSESTLNSERIMTITGVVKRIAFRVWVELVGNDSLTEEQFIERSNTRIAELCLNRFGKNILIRPETYFENNERATWNTKVHIGSPHQRIANNVSVVTHAYDDLLNSSI